MEYKIPLFKLNFDGAEEQAVLETIKSQWISIGPRCAEFEALFAEMLSAKHAVSMSNCTDALHLALRALEIGAGDEVICPSLTFVASVNAIRYVGATPVFCDIKSVEHINIGVEKIKELLTPKTKAIMVVHIAGFACEMDEIMALARAHDLKVIEDACHGPLSEYRGKKLGTIGDIGCFSFFSNKNISTGEGGMIVTNDAELEKKIRLLRSHGMTTMSYQRAKGHATAYDVVELGYNFRMDDIRASIGIAQLKKLENDLRARERVRSSYVEFLSGEDRIEIPFRDNTEFVSNYIMPVVLKDSTAEKRDAVRDRLHQAGIQTSVHYPPIHRFSIYKDYPANLPVTDYVTDNEITLPMYAALSSDDVEFICSNLSAVLDEY
jgi:dTDP-4-amino-4,6-dideoxygalactose transaminase